MKIKKSFLIFTMVLISLFAIGAVSAVDDANITDDADNLATIENDVDVDEIVAANGDENVLNDGDGSSGCSTDDQGGQGSQGGQGGQGTQMPSFGNGTWGNGTWGGNGSTFNFDFGNMSIGDLFGGLFGGSSDTIKCNNLNLYYNKITTYKVKLTDSKGNPLSGKVISFAINNKIVGATTDGNGVAKLKVKLKPGSYVVTAQYGDTTVLNTIKIKNNILTKDMTKKYNKKGKFKIKVVTAKGKPLKKVVLKIKFNKKTYKLKTNKKGKAVFKLPKNLEKGKYKIKIICNGLSKKNTITVK